MTLLVAWFSPMRSWELNFMILMVPFQLQTFHGSTILGFQDTQQLTVHVSVEKLKTDAEEKVWMPGTS